MRNNPIVILGAGITGLSAAWYLEKQGFTDITVLEESPRAGGKIETLHEHGFLIEKGPDSFIITKPYAIDLVRELGLENELIHPKTNRFFILNKDKLSSPPKGLNMMVPTDLFAFLESNFFSWSAKHRILHESVVLPRLSDDDESFADFIIRRFGQEMLDLYAGPLFTGIYATPSEELSLNATFPVLKKMAQQYGSLTRAVKKQVQTSSKSRSSFMGLKNGMQTLPDTLVKKLQHTNIKLNSKVTQLDIDGLQYIVKTGNGDSYAAGNLIITLPAHQTKQLLHSISPQASDILGSFTTSSSRIVTLTYKKEKLNENLLATGYVSAETENNLVSSGTWLSSKWEGRAPDGHILLRCFMGKNPQSLSMNNDQLIHAAHLEMSALLNLKEAPEYYWVQRWDYALPQYKVGHLEKVNALREALSSFHGLQISGSYLSGVGLPDCINQGLQAAKNLNGAKE